MHGEELIFNDDQLVDMSFRNMVWFYKKELTDFLHGNNNALNEHEKKRLCKQSILYIIFVRTGNKRKFEYRVSKKTLDILKELESS